MKTRFFTIPMLSACLIGSAAAATNFITSGGNITDAANWDNGLPASGDVFQVTGSTLSLVPEPASTGLVLIGLLGLGLRRRR